MKFYMLLAVIGVVLASDISADVDSDEADPQPQPKVMKNRIIYGEYEGAMYRIIKTVNKPKRTEYLTTAEDRETIRHNFNLLAARVEEILKGSQESWADEIRGVRRELSNHQSEVTQLLRVLYPFLEKSQTVEQIKHRAARNIGHGVQPNGQRPGNSYNPYGNANEKPHHGHQGHQGHHQGQHRPNHH